MISTQKELEQLVSNTLNKANEKLKEFELFGSCLEKLFDSHSEQVEHVFRISDFEEHFNNLYCTPDKSIIAKILHKNIVDFFFFANGKNGTMIKEIDYFSESDLKDIENLDPQFSLGTISESDRQCELSDKIKKIKVLYTPNTNQEESNYVIFIKNEKSARIAFKFDENFHTWFLKLAANEEDLNNNNYPEGLFEFPVDTSTIEATEETIKKINFSFCYVVYYYHYKPAINPSEILVYKINRSNR